MQSVPITTKVVTSNPVYWEVYSIQHYVIKFVGDRLVVFSIQHYVIKFVGDKLVVFSIQHYVIKFVGDRLVVFSGFIHQ